MSILPATLSNQMVACINSVHRANWTATALAIRIGTPRVCACRTSGLAERQARTISFAKDLSGSWGSREQAESNLDDAQEHQTGNHQMGTQLEIGIGHHRHECAQYHETDRTESRQRLRSPGHSPG